MFMDKEKLKVYHEREVRWAENALSQLSFFNNLLLTLAVGFLSFAYKDIGLKNIHFSCCEINWSITFKAISLVFIGWSILLGLLVALNRLLDFRLTRKIAQIRRRVYKYASGTMLSEKTPTKFNCIRKLFLPFEVLCSHPNITMEQCKNYKEEMSGIFIDLRNIAHNLGLNAWRQIIFQILCFGLSILFYVLGIITS